MYRINVIFVPIASHARETCLSKKRTKNLVFENGLVEESWFDTRQGLEIFLHSKASGLVPESIQSPIQLMQGVKRPGRDAGQSPSSTAEAEN